MIRAELGQNQPQCPSIFVRPLVVLAAQNFQLVQRVLPGHAWVDVERVVHMKLSVGHLGPAVIAGKTAFSQLFNPAFKPSRVA